MELQTRYGKLQVPDHDNDLIGRFLCTYGEWSSYEVQFVAGAIEPGARVADVGAFVGTFGLGLLAHRPLGLICFVEANPQIVPLLRTNVARNAVVPAVVVDAVVIPSAMRGAVTASVEEDNAGSFSVHESDTAGRVSAELVSQQLTLGELRAQHGPFDLIKLDVEGLENALLEDDIDFVTSGTAKLWIECNDSAASLLLCQTLLDTGLNVYYCAFPVYAASNYNESREKIFPWAYESGLWATRGAAPLLDPELAEAGCFLHRIRSIVDLRQALWDTPRWSPAEWTDETLATVVARACHTILGERFEESLNGARIVGKRTSWADPLPIQMQRQLNEATERIRRLQEQLAKARSVARSNETMLHAEREWIAIRCKKFEADDTEIVSLQEQLAEARSVARSNEAMLHAAREWIAIRCKKFDADDTEIVSLQEQLAEARSVGRSNEVMLHAEREWIAIRCKKFESDDIEIASQSRELIALKGSRSYRLLVRLHSFASRHPRTYRLARSVAARTWRVLRHARPA